MLALPKADHRRGAASNGKRRRLFCLLDYLISNSPYAGMAHVGGLEGCKPSNHPSFSRAAEA